MICNYVSRIIPALQSRCTRFRFSPLEDSQIVDRLGYIVKQENLVLKPDGEQALLRLANGDMRKVLNILQATAAAFDVIDGNAVYSTTGSPLPSDVESVLKWLLEEDYMLATTRIFSLKTVQGIALADLVRELHDLVTRVRSLVALSFIANAEVLLLVGAPYSCQDSSV